jgi:hypothetical protein
MHSNDKDNILITTLKGPIDLATVKFATWINVRCFSELDHTEIGCIFVLDKSMRVTADALDYYDHILKRHKEDLDKKVSVAYVVPLELEGRSLTSRLLSEIYATYHIPFQVFEKLDDAREWLTSLMISERAVN